MKHAIAIALILTAMVEMIESKTDKDITYILINNGECAFKVPTRLAGDWSYVDRMMDKHCAETIYDAKEK
jgi:hypothetical protein